MTFSWKRHNYKVPVELVAERVQELEARYGVCHPGLLVNDARSVESPLHTMFEWDDSVAAESYRIDQARGILQSIRVQLSPGETPVPAFVHVKVNTEPGYAGIVRAMSDADMRSQVLSDALRQLEALKLRYDTLSELQGVWEALSQVTTPRRRRSRNPVGAS